MKSITVSAPGKIHLMGEHAVVYGRPALLAAVNRRTAVTVEEPRLPKGSQSIEIHCTEPDIFIRQSVGVITKKLNMRKLSPVRICIDSKVTPGYHLGSSASIAVALSGALMKFWKDEFDKQKINDIAYSVEKIAHGNPSGGDNTTVTYGGFLWYQKKSESEKLFRQLPFTMQDKLNNFYLINTGRPKENTGYMVGLVKERYDHQPAEYKKLFDMNEKQVDRIMNAVEKGNEGILIDAIRKGEKTLEDMGVVSKKVQPLIRSIEKSGGAAKILGGGGVSDGIGYLLCYHSNRKAVKKIVSRFRYPLQPVTLGEEGVRIKEQ